jgi:hypothetical protein
MQNGQRTLTEHGRLAGVAAVGAEAVPVIGERGLIADSASNRLPPSIIHRRTGDS